MCLKLLVINPLITEVHRMVDIQEKIKEQGDLVRKLKAEKAAKEQVSKEEW
jgi:hypothetical protein